jgi:predicted aspartyl protease
MIRTVGIRRTCRRSALKEPSVMFRVIPILAAVVLGTVVRAGAATDPVPDTFAINAKVEGQLGTYSPDYRLVVQGVQSNGVTWKETRSFRGQDFRVDRRTDIAETQQGRYKGDAWHQTLNGFTIVHDHAGADAGSDLLFASQIVPGTVTRTNAPDGYRISALNPAGYGTVQYVDAQTWRVTRVEVKDAAGVSTTTYGPLVTIGNRKFPGYAQLHDAESKIDTRVTVLSYQPGVIAEGDVAIPPDRRSVVEFPPGVDTVTLPSHFYDNAAAVYVTLTIGGTGYDFVLDSGASSMTIDPRIVAKLGLTTFDAAKNAVNAGPVDTALVKIGTIGIGPLTMHDVILEELPANQEAPGVSAVGLLGFDFLAENGVLIDYVHHTVTMHRNGTYALAPSRTTNILPISLDDQVPEVSAKINGASADRLIVDTGMQGTLMLFSYFAGQHPTALVDKDAGGLSAPRMRFTGVGGEIPTKAYELGEVDLGSMRFVDFLAFFVAGNGYVVDADGLFGGGFLRLYDVYFDYPHGQMAITLNDLGHRAAGK